MVGLLFHQKILKKKNINLFLILGTVKALGLQIENNFKQYQSQQFSYSEQEVEGRSLELYETPKKKRNLGAILVGVNCPDS